MYKSYHFHHNGNSWNRSTTASIISLAKSLHSYQEQCHCLPIPSISFHIIRPFHTYMRKGLGIFVCILSVLSILCTFYVLLVFCMPHEVAAPCPVLILLLWLAKPCVPIETPPHLHSCRMTAAPSLCVDIHRWRLSGRQELVTLGGWNFVELCYWLTLVFA